MLTPQLNRPETLWRPNTGARISFRPQAKLGKAES
jgi:hypothetical protein